MVFNLCICGFLGHIQISGNQQADLATKAAALTNVLVDVFAITTEDCTNKVTDFIKNCRVDEWNAFSSNKKLKRVEDNPLKRQLATGRSRH